MLVFLLPVIVAVNCCWPPTVNVTVTGVRVTTMGGTIVTVAVLDLVGSATKVAVTNTCAGLGTVGGAKYRPLGEMLPQAAPLQPVPVTLQETLVLEMPLTVAVNCWLPPITTCAETGAMLTDTGPLTVTVAWPVLALSATEVAVTVTWFGVGTVPGAVYSPPVDIDPQVAPLQPLPATLHDTAVFDVPITVAANCWCPPVRTCAVAGETVTEIGGMMVTEAVADFVGSAAEVAVTETCGGLGTADGAVYNPLVDIEPQAAPVQPLPAMLHDTAVFDVPVTVAVNCLWPPVSSCTVTGEIVTETGGMIVTEAVADFVGSAAEVVVTDTWGGLGIAEGAVYSPPVEIVPQVAPLQPLPATLHDTAVFDVPVTVAVNCWWPPVSSCAVAGETVTETGGMIVTEAVSDFVGSATEVALTDTWGGLGTADGAVYSPLVDIVPQVAPLQPLPTTLHDTAMFDVPVTVAVNCWWPPVSSCAVAGETVTETGGMIVTDAVADFVGSAAEVAVTDTWGGLGIAEGAV
jgi:hypothetical protein